METQVCRPALPEGGAVPRRVVEHVETRGWRPHATTAAAAVQRGGTLVVAAAQVEGPRPAEAGPAGASRVLAVDGELRAAVGGDEGRARRCAAAGDRERQGDRG